ncbi:hypothetical protein O1611_g3457 [Lasiodiplodia mahajangana]|uniref:Uncharacterized protein n=1 Tax=Lasiodiplodia mahajangana TaxID=1108764 RepID=A0ACC2JRS2_9PEZI|nr:hypothetical protein O1611_g3457 [Lasiodiplodia mahajangana]
MAPAANTAARLGGSNRKSMASGAELSHVRLPTKFSDPEIAPKNVHEAPDHARNMSFIADYEKVKTNASGAGQAGTGVRLSGLSRQIIKHASFHHLSSKSIRKQATCNEDISPNSRPSALSSSGSKKPNISLVSQLKHRVTGTAGAVPLALDTHHEQQDHHATAAKSSPPELTFEFIQRGKSDTTLTNHDIPHNVKLQGKLNQEIKKNYNEEAKAGFLPGSRLFELLNLEALKQELSRSDTLLERYDKRLSHLKFHFPKDGTREEAIGDQAQEIIGDPWQEKSTQNASNEGSSASKPAYLKIMAILILIERPSRIKLFIDSNVSDADLPLELVGQDASDSSTTWELRKADGHHVPLKCFEGWSYSTVKRFEELQWSFIAPYFRPAKRKTVPHYSFHPQTILPFKFVKTSNVSEGGFGRVYRVEIHPDHRGFANSKSSNSSFAVKTLNGPRDENAFKREVATLSRLSDNTHSHLISLLGTFEKNGVYNLIFPWAEADLLHYWKRKQSHKSDEALRWMAQQCQGIADGLSYIHRLETTSGKSLLHPNSMDEAGDVVQRNGAVPAFFLCGLHGDIKPENILWFPYSNDPAHKGRGVLKITDFGFTEFSRKDRIDKTRRGFIAISPTYYPPEAKLDNSISSSYDIWSLGCVYLEFTAWWLGGWRLISKFSARRLNVDSNPTPWEGLNFELDGFFDLARNGENGKLEVGVKSSVSKFIDELKVNPRSNDFVVGFLDMIKSDMLVVEKPAGGSPGQYRKSSTRIVQALEAMRMKHGWVDRSTSRQSTMILEGT